MIKLFKIMSLERNGKAWGTLIKRFKAILKAYQDRLYQ